MKVSVYKALLADLGLTEEQTKKITQAFEALIEPVAAIAFQSRRQPEYSDIHNYQNGKADGLNMAFKFFANTLQFTDELEHDEYVAYVEPEEQEV